jgi:hypothetical protein
MLASNGLPLKIRWLSGTNRRVIIRIPTHDIDAGGRVEIAENLAFAPWHALPEHRPLGANNRARRIIYI